MHKRITLLTFAFTFLAACASPALAQDYHRGEFAVGYSHLRAESSEGVHVISFGPGMTLEVDPCTSAGLDFFGPEGQRQLCERSGHNGLDASAVFNFNRYVGIKGNISGHFKTKETSSGGTTGELKARIYQFLGGVQLKDNSKETRVKPFAHALFGLARQSFEDVSNTPGAPPPFDSVTVTGTRTDFAMKLGGGIDVRVGRRVDLRLVEFNYNPIFGGESSLDVSAFPGNPTVTRGRTSHNFTVGFGVVIH